VLQADASMMNGEVEVLAAVECADLDVVDGADGWA
jgi:hypothetical protein